MTRALAVADEDLALARQVLTEGADTRARAAEAAAAELEAFRRANPGRDVRPSALRVARLLAEAATLRALAGAEAVDLEASPRGTPDASAVAVPAQAGTLAPNPDSHGSADYPLAPEGLPVRNLPDTQDAGGGAGAASAPPDGPAEPDDIDAGDAAEPTPDQEEGTEVDATRPQGRRTPDIRLDDDGNVVAVSGRQAARQALSKALTEKRPAYEKGAVYALNPGTLDLIAAIEGEDMSAEPVPSADEVRAAFGTAAAEA